MNRIDKLYLAAKDLFPKRIYLAVRIDGEERKLPIAEIHRMLHEGKITGEDIEGEKLNGGNCGKDLDIFLHLISCHGPNCDHDLPEEVGNRGLITSKEKHNYFLSKEGEY